MATYEPKNILITGAAGFIASHVANRLVRNYPHYKIVVLDKLDYCSSLKNLNPSRPSPNFKFVKGDIASADLVNYLLITESIDTIMHFAAQTHVDNSFGNSFEFTKNNIYGTHVLLEACKVTGQIRRFIHVSTDEVYGETDEDAVVGNHEASQLLPTNPYSATKAGAEMLVMAYGRSYGLPVITTRGNNVYGPNQFPEKLIPKFILLAMRGLPLPIHGDGSNVRSYLYCEDVAEAFEVVLHKGEVGHVYNIGTVKERRVIDVAKDICKLFGLDTEKVIRFVENRPFNDQRYFLDDQKLKRLGWAERTPWEEGLKKTIEWYTTNPDYWGDVTGALLPHPRMLMTPGVERHNWTEEIKSLASSPAETKESSTTAPAATINSTSSAPQKPSYKFLIYGRTGWIGGLLGKICEKQEIPYEYGKGRLEERSQLLQDIRSVRPTHVFNAAGVTGRPNVDWCESHKQDTIRTNVVGTLNLADVCREQGLLMINYATGCIFAASSGLSVRRRAGRLRWRPCLPRMDQRKAIFRAKLRETKEKQQRRIDPSLVRYNEYDQPICRVCNIALKSEALWPAHQVSRKHHEAKAAAAAGPRGNNAKQEQSVELQKEKSSTLPTNFFDNQGTKRQSDDAGSEGRSLRCQVPVVQSKTKEASTNKPPVRLDQMAKKGSQTNTNVKGILPGNFFDYEEEEAPAPAPKEMTSTSGNIASSNHMQVKGVPDGFFDNNKNGNGMQPSEPSSLSNKDAKSSGTAQVKGSLPEGFFDNKDADLRARGIQPKKVDMNDAYKEFEKEIHEDLQEVDERLEEEEIDAAAEREEYLTLEQQEYRQQVDMLKKQLIESKAARTAKANSKPVGMDMESSSDSSRDEEDDNTDFAVDWRAQHLK